jgi:hypothetical protein
MLTDRNIYEWLDAQIPAHVDREGALRASRNEGWEEAVLDLANEAYADGAISRSVLLRLCKEYPDGDLNQIFSHYLANLVAQGD